MAFKEPTVQRFATPAATTALSAVLDIPAGHVRLRTATSPPAASDQAVPRQLR
ncbi:hypothetical protein [Streptomyces sp. NPDC127092]|uniref:hypothetical protein n=1 Tax=Streptomyces sp. NPDC127092 TaxID=3347135 RepID=UPI00365942E0